MNLLTLFKWHIKGVGMVMVHAEYNRQKNFVRILYENLYKMLCYMMLYTVISHKHPFKMKTYRKNICRILIKKNFINFNFSPFFIALWLYFSGSCISQYRQ